MPGPNVQLFRAERVAEQVGFLDRDVEQVSLTRGLIMSDSRFKQMAGIVKFMAVDRVQLPTFGSGPAMRTFGIDSPRCVEIPIRFLGLGNFGDQIIQVAGQFWIRLYGEGVRSTL